MLFKPTIFMVSGGQTAAHAPQPTHFPKSTTGFMVSGWLAGIISMALYEHTALHLSHSVRSVSRHLSRSILTDPINSSFLASRVKGLIAPLGQTVPRRLQFSGQYPPWEKNTSGVIQAVRFSVPVWWRIIRVGQALIQLPESGQGELGRVKKWGVRIGTDLQSVPAKGMLAKNWQYFKTKF